MVDFNAFWEKCGFTLLSKFEVRKFETKYQTLLLKQLVFRRVQLVQATAKFDAGCFPFRPSMRVVDKRFETDGEVGRLMSLGKDTCVVKTPDGTKKTLRGADVFNLRPSASANGSSLCPDRS